MFQEDQLIEELGLENLTPEQQQNVLDEYSVQVGEVLAQNLSEDQLKEFEAIINGEQPVIDAWLATNAPNYKDETTYKELEVGYDEDPEKVPADKVYASMAWIEVNSPNFRDTVAEIKEKIKANIDLYKD